MQKQTSKNNVVDGSKNGRVNVFARTRPFLSREDGDLKAVDMNEESGECVVSTSPDVMSCLNESKVEIERKEKSYKFDAVFPPDCSQKDVFQRVGLPVLVEVMKGFNGCIFAYGQTGSGKTYSLIENQVSDMEQVGILPRLVATMYARAAMDKKYVYTIKAAGFQVYNEQVDDLLHPDFKKGAGQNLTINKGGGMPNLSWIECGGPKDMLDSFKKARNGIYYAETKMNKASSRSHAVFQIRIIRRQRMKQGDNNSTQGTRTMQATCGQLSVVDLAGSERVKRSGVTGSNFKEATNINGSLLALGNVIQALADKRKHVPFRDSKLTRILEGSVGGNCKTSLLVCVSPAETSTSETLSTLEFASRAMRVQVDAKVNETMIEIDASQLAADMEDTGGAGYVDEEMMKTYKESEQALAAAEQKMQEQEKKAESLKAKVNEMENVLSEKDKNLNDILKTNKKQMSQIDLLKQELVESEEKHAKDLENSKKVTATLKSQVAKAEQEVNQTKMTLKTLTQKHIAEQRARQEAQQRIEVLQKEMIVKEEAAQKMIKQVESANEELKVELQEEIKQRHEEKKQLEAKITQEQVKCSQLEVSLKGLESVKSGLSTDIISMTSKIENMSQLLQLEKQKVEKLNVIQEEAKELRSQLGVFKEKEEVLQSRLEQIQEEKGNLASTVNHLEANCMELKQSYEREAKVRHDLESDKEKLMNNLKTTEQTLDEKQTLLRATEIQMKEEITNLKGKYENDINVLEIKAKQEVEKREKHASEAIQALELRAQQEHEKMESKIKSLNEHLLEQEKEHQAFVSRLKENNTKELAEVVARERETHSREVTNLRRKIDQGLQDLKVAEQRHKDEMKMLQKQQHTALNHARSSHQAARVAVEQEKSQVELRYAQLEARFKARESRSEDLALIARQQRDINDMKKAVKHAKIQTKQKQLELDHVLDNVRIFGTPHDHANSRKPILPGQKVGDHSTFLNRAKSKTPTNQHQSRDHRYMPRVRNPVDGMVRPKTSASALGSSRLKKQLSSSSSASSLREEIVPPRTVNRSRPLPMPPV